MVSETEWWGGVRDWCEVSVHACDVERCASEEKGKLVEGDLGGHDIATLAGGTIAIKARGWLEV